MSVPVEEFDGGAEEDPVDRNSEAWELAEADRRTVNTKQCPCTWQTAAAGNCQCGHSADEWHDADECWALVPA